MMYQIGVVKGAHDGTCTSIYNCCNDMIIMAQEEIVRYKKQYEEMLTERNKFKQQCTQVSSGIITHYHLCEMGS